MNHAILLISCPDRKGITATVTNFIYQHGGNILHSDQHIDEQTNTFFMRVEWSLKGFDIPKERIEGHLQPIAQRFGMKWELCFADRPLRAAIFVSKHLHCLYDLLYRRKAGHFSCTIPLIVSNHPDAKPIAREFRIPFHVLPITPKNKNVQETKELKLLEKEKIDFIVLARYHQILGARFVNKYRQKIINIHHSFLPAFAGKSPYRQAHQKGVKIIGATSHYVTERLDEGPIIEQDTVRISHRDSLNDLVRKGEDLEKMVLNRAVRWHLERKILCYGNKTVIFD